MANIELLHSNTLSQNLEIVRSALNAPTTAYGDKAVKVNAAVLSDSATKLATARTLWGNPFDGNGDVSGGISDCNYIMQDITGGYYIGNRKDGLGDTEGGLLLAVY